MSHHNVHVHTYVRSAHSFREGRLPLAIFVPPGILLDEEDRKIDDPCRPRSCHPSGERLGDRDGDCRRGSWSCRVSCLDGSELGVISSALQFPVFALPSVDTVHNVALSCCNFVRNGCSSCPCSGPRSSGSGGSGSGSGSGSGTVFDCG